MGLLSSPPSQQKKKKSPADDESDDEADLEDEAGINPIDQDSKRGDFPSYTVQEAKLSTSKETKTPPEGGDVDEEYIRQLEASEEKRQALMDAFLDDPATSMAVFFSSHYRDKGLIWFVNSALFYRIRFLKGW